MKIKNIKPYLKAFLAGVMCKPNRRLDSVLAAYLTPPDVKWFRLGLSKPKRKRTSKRKITLHKAK